MPTYEYVCQKCQHEFEQYQSIAADALTVCPKENCGLKKWGKGKVKRAISTGGGLLFKGSGFYITDYRSENYKASAKKDVAPASGGSGSSDTKGSSDSKSSPAPATTPAPTPKTESKPAKTPKAGK